MCSWTIIRYSVQKKTNAWRFSHCILYDFIIIYKCQIFNKCLRNVNKSQGLSKNSARKTTGQRRDFMAGYVEMKDATKVYQMGEVSIKAVDGIDFEIQKSSQ